MTPSPRRLTRFLPAVVQLEDRCTPAAVNVTSLGDTVAVDGAVTLREAIESVNAGANVNADVTATGYGTGDTITFTGLSGTINLQFSLNPIRKSVAIIGPTVTDPRGFNVPLVTVDANNGNGVFLINAPNVTLRGLSIVGADYGVALDFARNAVIAGNFIGLRSDGVTAEGNFFAGIHLRGGSSNNTIGGPTPADRNVISGHGRGGNGTGVVFEGTGVTGNVVAGNYIGTNAAGTAAVPNHRGVLVSGGASNNTIGGTAAGAGNLISGNSQFGVLIFGAGTTGNVVAGNRIGTNAAGAADVPNNLGVLVTGGASGNTVGDSAAGAGNVISGNNIGVQITGAGTTGNVIAGNRIGRSVFITIAVPNDVGVEVTDGASGNTVGGAPGAGNFISGNRQFGVRVRGAGTTGTVIAGNSISSSGEVGVEVSGGATNTVIGGTVAGAGNQISFNAGAGVFVAATANGVRVLGNSIRSNTGQGIDLSATATPDGVTANDRADTDAGGNGRQNFPVITSVAGADVAGVLSSTPNRTFRVELFASDTRHPSGFGGGERFLGFVTVTTDATGAGSFAFTAPSDLTNQFVTATATDLATNSTSEFGNAMRGPTPAPSIIFPGNTSPLIPALTPPQTPPSTPPNTPNLVRFDPIVPAGVTPAVRGGQLSPTAGGPQALGPKSALVVGAGRSRGGQVVVYNPDGSERGQFVAFPGFGGTVQVGTADVNNDGYPDVLAAAGPGGGPHVKVLNGVSGFEIYSFFAYDPGFTGGVWVAGGDLNGDGFAEIITGAGAGGGPHVKAFDGQTGVEIAGFYAYAPTFAGGVTVAAGDVNNDGLADIITGAGGAPHVKVIEGTSLRQLNADGTVSDAALLASFYAYAPAFTGGVFVASGADFDGDGRMDIVTGAGGGAGPHVKVIAVLAVGGGASDGSVPDRALLGSFYAFDETFAGGVRVGVADVDRNGEMEVVAGPGPGIAPRARILRATGQPAVGDILAFDEAFRGGVFVA